MNKQRKIRPASYQENYHFSDHDVISNVEITAYPKLALKQAGISETYSGKLWIDILSRGLGTVCVMLLL